MCTDYNRIILQDRLTGRFLGCNGDWTSSLAEARTFVDVPTAVNTAVMGELFHVDIVIHFPAPAPELRLPLTTSISELCPGE